MNAMKSCGSPAEQSPSILDDTPPPVSPKEDSWPQSDRFYGVFRLRAERCCHQCFSTV